MRGSLIATWVLTNLGSNLVSTRSVARGVDMPMSMETDGG